MSCNHLFPTVTMASQDGQQPDQKKARTQIDILDFQPEMGDLSPIQDLKGPCTPSRRQTLRLFLFWLSLGLTLCDSSTKVVDEVLKKHPVQVLAGKTKSEKRLRGDVRDLYTNARLLLLLLLLLLWLLLLLLLLFLFLLLLLALSSCYHLSSSSVIIICRYHLSLCSFFQCDLISLCQWLIVMVLIIMSICTQCKSVTQKVEFVVEKRISVMASQRCELERGYDERISGSAVRKGRSTSNVHRASVGGRN